MRRLPENFTDEQHAAWIRRMEKKEKWNDLIAKLVVGIIASIFIAYALLRYLNGTPEIQKSMEWWTVGGLVYWNLNRRFDVIEKKLANITQKLGLD